MTKNGWIWIVVVIVLIIIGWWWAMAGNNQSAQAPANGVGTYPVDTTVPATSSVPDASAPTY